MSAAHGLGLSLDQAPALYHFIVGALGGLLYVGRQYLKGYRVRVGEYFLRPLFGASAAVLINMSMGYPSHPLLFCIFIGWFGVDVFDAILARSESAVAKYFKHEKPADPAPATEPKPPGDGGV